MRALIPSILLVACSSPDLSSRRVIVNALTGDEAAAAVTVVSHAEDGTLVDQVVTDASGRASVKAGDDALISVVFRATTDTSTTIRVVTMPAPAAELTVYGPANPARPDPVVGTLNINGPALPDATVFTIDLGCAYANIESLPAAIDIGACSMGTDDQLDVLVRGGHLIGDLASQLDGYAASRLVLANGTATLDVGSWEAATTNVPVAVDAAGASLELSLFCDGLPFGTQDLTDHATLWNGLIVDASAVTAHIPGNQGERHTVRHFDGVPTAVTFAATDFLPAIEPSVQLTSLEPLALSWAQTPIGDAVELHVTWRQDGVGTRGVITWDAVLPPEAASVAFPKFVDELAIATSREKIESDQVALEYIDNPSYDGFTDFAAAGVHVGDANPDVPGTNALLVSRAWGLR